MTTRNTERLDKPKAYELLWGMFSMLVLIYLSFMGGLWMKDNLRNNSRPVKQPSQIEQPKTQPIAPKEKSRPERKIEQATPAKSGKNGKFQFAMKITKSDLASMAYKVEIKEEKEKER